MPQNPEAPGAPAQGEDARPAEPQAGLPAGVSETEWALERAFVQNARIRALLGSIRLLEEVRESELTILRCSPDRLLEIWEGVAEVGKLIHDEVAPFLLLPSKVPRLEAARQRAVKALETLSGEVLGELTRVGEQGDERKLGELRRSLSLSIGRLHQFLQETFADLMAADPRSRADPDYFLSKRFGRDVQDAEELYLAVDKLDRYLKTVEARRERDLLPVIERLEGERTIPRGATWEGAEALLESLAEELVAKLWELLTLNGIRYYETKILDHYAAQIPSEARTIVTLHSVSWWTLDKIGCSGFAAGDVEGVERTLAAELARHMRALDLQLRNLVQYLPGWLSALSRRRALLVRMG